MNTLRKFIDRLCEKFQRAIHSHNIPFKIHRKLDDRDCDALQVITESPGWEIARIVLENINYRRNEAAIGFCDGRSFIEYKKMEGAKDFFETIEEIVKIHKEKTKPVQEYNERPRKLAEYVPR